MDGSCGSVVDRAGMGAGHGTFADRTPGGSDRAPSENIALGASDAMEPAPNYRLCSDPGDAKQLTDGVYTDGFFWAQKSTVGYQEKTPTTVTIDLGEAKPIRGLSYHTAGGFADVHWSNENVDRT